MHAILNSKRRPGSHYVAISANVKKCLAGGAVAFAGMLVITGQLAEVLSPYKFMTSRALLSFVTGPA